MIQVEGISKWYGAVRALNNLSCQISKGEIVGFLGPNGAGKTTMMKILTTFLYPDKGWGKVCGLDISRNPLKVRQHIGYLPETTPLYEDMNVVGFLKFIARARGLLATDASRAVREILGTCGLEDVQCKPISTLSKGYRQRVGLAQAMVHKPDVLILDEPTSGLDPNQIQDVREVIRTIGQERTVILSTHILSEVQAVCSRVLIVNQGNLVADDSLEHLQKQKSNRFSAMVKGDQQKLEGQFGKMEKVKEWKLEPHNGEFLLTAESSEENDLGEKIFLAVKKANGTLRELRGETRDLEDIFRELTTR